MGADAQVVESGGAKGTDDTDAAAVGGRADKPGGGDATTSGSSISSKGKSGNCSSKGETGTLAKPFGTTGLASVPVEDGAGAVETNAAAPAADELPPVGPATGELTVTKPAAPEPAVAGLVVAEPAVAGLAGVAVVRATPVEPVGGGLPAGELVLAAIPTGLMAFFLPVAEMSLDDGLDVGGAALREVKPVAPDALEVVVPPIGTPTGLEVPAAGRVRLIPV